MNRICFDIMLPDGLIVRVYAPGEALSRSQWLSLERQMQGLMQTIRERVEFEESRTQPPQNKEPRRDA